jgi:hypothetical protein
LVNRGGNGVGCMHWSNENMKGRWDGFQSWAC